MKCVVLWSAVLLALAGTPTLTAALIPATAWGFTETSAAGELNGVGWTATTSATAPFLGVNLSSGRWDVNTPLPVGALTLTASHVNGGDFQEFTFDAPVHGGLFYIENFDSSSVASIVTDAAGLQLSASSSSLSYASTSSSSGVLTTSNSNYNGEGDGIFEFLGPLTKLRIDYTAGEGANGIFYGFAQDSTQPTTTSAPEPSSLASLAVALTAGLLINRRRRRR